jgi:hypothetical protein
MESPIQEFALGDRITIPTHVVLDSRTATPKDLAAIRREGVWNPGPGPGTVDLVAGGQIVARGRLIRKRGSWYVRITEGGEA